MRVCRSRVAAEPLARRREGAEAMKGHESGCNHVVVQDKFRTGPNFGSLANFASAQGRRHPTRVIWKRTKGLLPTSMQSGGELLRSVRGRKSARAGRARRTQGQDQLPPLHANFRYLVPKKGLEPSHPCEYVDLNHARLPIPPLRLTPAAPCANC